MHAIQDFTCSVALSNVLCRFISTPSNRHGSSSQNLLKRAKELYPEDKDFFAEELLSFLSLKKMWPYIDYLAALDDGVIVPTSSFLDVSPDKILMKLVCNALSQPQVFKSSPFSQEDPGTQLTASHETTSWRIGFDPGYYTAIHKVHVRSENPPGWSENFTKRWEAGRTL